MPISSRKLVYDTVRKLNGLNTGMGQSFSVLDLVSAINDAYEIIVENNIKLTDTNSLVRDNLRKLEVKNYELPLENRGSYYFAKYPADLYKRLNHHVEVLCEGCVKSKIIIPRIVQSDDLHEARKNPYRKANFYWEQLIMDEGGDGLYIYTENEMSISKFLIDYYRKIKYIEAPSLVECNDYIYRNYDDRIISNDVDFDLDSTYIARKVTDVAVLLLRTDIKDTEAFNLKLQSIIQTDKIT
jgi:hypothetical protein